MLHLQKTLLAAGVICFTASGTAATLLPSGARMGAFLALSAMAAVYAVAGIVISLRAEQRAR